MKALGGIHDDLVAQGCGGSIYEVPSLYPALKGQHSSGSSVSSHSCGAQRVFSGSFRVSGLFWCQGVSGE